MVTFPSQNKTWKQVNFGELFGDIFASFGIDLGSNPGKVRLSTRTRPVTSSTDDNDLGYPVGIVRSAADSTDRWWAICGAVLFKTAATDPTATFTQDAIANTPTGLSYLYSDIEEYEDALHVSSSTNISRLVSGTWTASWWTVTLGQGSLTSNVYHPLKKIFNNLLLVGDDNFVHTVDESSNVRNRRLVLPKAYRIEWIETTKNRAWIGASNRFSGPAAVFEWNGRDENYTDVHYIDGSRRTYAGTVRDNVPFCVDGLGRLLRFTGIGFSEVDRFPSANGGFLPVDGTGISWADIENRPIHPNGMQVVSGEIHLLVNAGIGSSNTVLLENFSSGVWVWNENNGLHHRYSISQSAGTLVDYGAHAITIPGALTPTFDTNFFICGAGIFTDNGSTELKAIFKLTRDRSSRGFFVGPQIATTNLEETWHTVYAKFAKLAAATDAFVLKYRTTKNANFPARIAITWTDNTTFTSVSTGLANAVVGDEIEIVRGRGAGATAHISSIAYAAPTYTIVLDETLDNLSGTALARITGWKKAKSITSQVIQNDTIPVGKSSQWLQFKIEMRSELITNIGPELEELQVASSPHKKIA